MKITIPVGSLHLGGGCRVLAETANGLAKRGHQVQLVIPNGKPVDYPLACEVVKIPSLSAAYIPRADVILVNYYTTVFPSFQTSPSRCFRLSLGFEPMWSADKYGALETYLLPIPLASISTWHQDVLRRETGKESVLLHPGLDTSIFSPSPQPNVQRNVKRIFFIARGSSGYQFKGFEDFRAAMMNVLKQTRYKVDIHILCPEEAPPLDGLPAQILHKVDDKTLAEYYREADLFVSTSWYESFGYPVLEAMACGTLVVTTDSGGVRDFAVDRQTCLMVPPRDVSALTQAILRALEMVQTKEGDDIRRQAVQKAREFTWDRYISQLEEQLQRLAQQPVLLDSIYLDGTWVRNYERGKLLAHMEVWPHAVDLPVAHQLKDIIRDSVQYMGNTSVNKVCSAFEVAQQIQEALEQKKGLAVISLGDTECAILGLNRKVVEPYLTLPGAGYQNAGYDPREEEAEKATLFQAIEKASIVGVPLFRHGMVQRPLFHALSEKGLTVESKRWCDSTVFHKLVDTGSLQRFLREGSPFVLCIGNEGQRLADYLVKQGVIISGVIAPVQGLKDVPNVVKKASQINYHLALVAAGAASIPICTQLALLQQKVALDIGKVADEWVTGITTFLGETNYDTLLHPVLFTERQKQISLEFQSGYQKGMTDLVPPDLPLPLFTLPLHWVQRYMQNVPYRNENVGALVRNPLWLGQLLEETFQSKRPLSVVNLDVPFYQRLSLPIYSTDAALMNTWQEIDVIGIPYLESPYTAQQVVQNKRFQPQKGWIDRSTLEQLQFDYYGKWLIQFLRGKRLLLVSKEVRPIATFLQSQGFTIWGSIELVGGRQRVLSQIQEAKKFEVALVAAGTDTLIFNAFIANQMGKIALDANWLFRDFLRNICINFWTNHTIHKID